MLIACVQRLAFVSFVTLHVGGCFILDRVVTYVPPPAADESAPEEAPATETPTTQTQSCSDGSQNGSETGVDCGGDCAPCPSCGDGIQNQGETAVDCGGPCGACGTCSDQAQNGSETDVDCGGSCSRCAPDKLCAVGSDCTTGFCDTSKHCALPVLASSDTCANAPAVKDPLAPVVFFSDLSFVSNVGGEHGLGAYLTLYGLRFGATRASDSHVFASGKEVARYAAWNPPQDMASPLRARGLDSVTVELGPGVPLGAVDLVVMVGGRRSNAVVVNVLFSARTLFVDPAYSGGDSDGSVTKPLSSLSQLRAKTVLGGRGIGSGDIVFLRGGVYDQFDPGSTECILDYELNITAAEQPAAGPTPFAIVGYPNERAVIGVSGPTTMAMRLGNNRVDLELANLDITASDRAIEYYMDSSGKMLRLVGNRFSGGFGANFLIQFNSIGSLSMFGNRFFGSDYGTIHCLSSGTNPTVCDLGWNESSNVGNCVRHGFGNKNVLLYHDNFCTGSVYSALDIEENHQQSQLYNNVIVGGSVIDFNGYTQAASAQVIMRHNTFLNHGTGLRRTSGAFSVGPQVVFENNIFSGTGSSTIASSQMRTAMAATNNLYNQVSAATAPSGDTSPTSLEPLLSPATGSQPAEGDFTPLRTPFLSPAIDAGVTSSVCSDFFGRVRGAAPDIGAVEAP